MWGALPKGGWSAFAKHRSSYLQLHQQESLVSVESLPVETCNRVATCSPRSRCEGRLFPSRNYAISFQTAGIDRQMSKSYWSLAWTGHLATDLVEGMVFHDKCARSFVFLASTEKNQRPTSVTSMRCSWKWRSVTVPSLMSINIHDKNDRHGDF